MSVLPLRLYHRKAYFESDNFCNISSVNHRRLPAKLSQLLAAPGGYTAREGSAVSKPPQKQSRPRWITAGWHMHAEPPHRPRPRVPSSENLHPAWQSAA